MFKYELDTTDRSVGTTMRQLAKIGCKNVKAYFGGGGGDAPDGWIAVKCDVPVNVVEDLKKLTRKWGHNTFTIEGNQIFAETHN